MSRRSVGDEAKQGTVSTPDQDIVDEMDGCGAGRWTIMRFCGQTRFEERDDRWDLDPESSGLSRASGIKGSDPTLLIAT